MQIYDVRNNHLLKLIEEILNSPGENVDGLLIDKLLEEVMLATLICPACDAGLIMAGDENSKVIPAFTSMDEYNLEFDGADIYPVSWEFGRYYEYLSDETVEGIIINPHINDFFISQDLIINALENYPDFNNFNDASSLSKKELTEIFKKENKHIDELLFDKDSSYEDLIHELSKIHLYTFIASDKKTSKKIIKSEKLNSRGIFTINEFDAEYNLIFNSVEHMKALKQFLSDRDYYLYAFPTTLELMAKYVIELDWDGLILNYGFQNEVLPRDSLLSYLNDIVEESKENIKYDLSDYAYNI